MNSILQWIDVTLLYAETEDEYLNQLETLLKKLISMKLRLSVKKCVFATDRVDFVGRTIRVSDGQVTMKYHDKFYEAILKIGVPRTGVELA